MLSFVRVLESIAALPLDAEFRCEIGVLDVVRRGEMMRLRGWDGTRADLLADTLDLWETLERPGAPPRFHGMRRLQAVHDARLTAYQRRLATAKEAEPGAEAAMGSLPHPSRAMTGSCRSAAKRTSSRNRGNNTTASGPMPGTS
jgi:hypothetical protein